MKKTLFLVLLLSVLFSCSKKQSDNNKNDTYTELADSLFLYKNIANTDFVKHIYFSDDNLCYSDSTKKHKLISLDENAKLNITVPIISKQTGAEKGYIKSYVNAYYVSKQKKVGRCQPIIIYCSGDDYMSLILVVLDSINHAKSGIIIWGGEFGGPYEINDSISCFAENRYSKLKDDCIKTYKVNSFARTKDEGFKTIYKDSIVYKSQILGNGLIKTQEIDSVRIFNK